MTTKEDIQMQYADIYTQLRLVGFNEQEIIELKLTRRSLSYLRAYLDLAQQIEGMHNEDYEKMLGVEHFD